MAILKSRIRTAQSESDGAILCTGMLTSRFVIGPMEQSNAYLGNTSRSWYFGDRSRPDLRSNSCFFPCIPYWRELLGFRTVPRDCGSTNDTRRRENASGYVDLAMLLTSFQSCTVKLLGLSLKSRPSQLALPFILLLLTPSLL